MPTTRAAAQGYDDDDYYYKRRYGSEGRYRKNAELEIFALFD